MIVYSVYLAEINFYGWLINRNLHNYILEEIINNNKNKYTTKKQKKECEALIPVTRIKLITTACKMKDVPYVRCRKKISVYKA